MRNRGSCFFVCARRIHHNRRKYFNGHIIVTERKEKVKLYKKRDTIIAIVWDPDNESAFREIQKLIEKQNRMYQMNYTVNKLGYSLIISQQFEQNTITLAPYEYLVEGNNGNIFKMQSKEFDLLYCEAESDNAKEEESSYSKMLNTFRNSKSIKVADMDAFLNFYCVRMTDIRNEKTHIRVLIDWMDVVEAFGLDEAVRTNDDFITSYIEWHPSLKHDSCIKMVFVYNTANEKITLDVDMTPEEYQKAAKRFVDQFEITFGRSLESECNARLSHCDLDALTGIPYGKRQ